MNKKYKFLSLLLAFVMAFSLMGTALADGEDAPVAFEVTGDYSGKLVILHTNDVHGGVVASESVLGMAAVAQLKADYEAAGAEVLLLDAGDEIQGDPIVNFSEGETAAEFMNAVGYQAMTLGNHEFDFGLANMLELEQLMDFPLLSANIVYTNNNKLVFDANVIFETELGLKVGVFGLTTPETATKAHPAKIQGISFLQGEELYKAAEAQVKELETAGCDIIVCLSHLGIDGESEPNRSTDVIAKVSGIDLFIDGHSHSVIDGNAAENQINGTMLVSTGTKLANIGVVVYDGKDFDAKLVAAGSYAGIDKAVEKLVGDMNAEIDAVLGEVFATTSIDLNGERDPGVRTEETNLGDLIADALVWYAEAQGETVDAAITNGGGIRASIKAGDITKKDINTVLPFGNTVSIVQVSGAELLEALEASTCSTPEAIGAFPQVSGIEFTVNAKVAYADGDQYPGSTYFAPANPGARVTIATVGGEAFDMEATYTIATNDFLAAGGDTYYAFKAAKVNYDLGVPMDQAVMDYIETVLEGNVGEDYAKAKGQITIVQPSMKFTDVTTANWFYDAVLYVYENGIMNGVSDTTFEPSTAMSRAMLVTTLYRMEDSPAVTDQASVFTDVEAGKWYSDAVAWAYANKIVNGTSETTFAPNDPITRQQMATLIYNYCAFKGLAPEGDWTIDFSAYTDKADIKDWAAKGVSFCNITGLMAGETATTFVPGGNSSRAQGATILMRLLETDLAAAQFPGLEVIEPEITGKVESVSKYGNITTDIAKADFDKLFTLGDIVTVIVGGKNISAPYGDAYSNVDNGSVVVLPDGDKIAVAINMGNFSETYKAVEATEIGFAMKEKGGYLEEYEIRNIDSLRTNVRADYSSDAVFANFREVTLGDIAPGMFYRSSSPVNPELGRNTYADNLAKDAKIATFINLADSEEVLKAYEGFGSSYYKTVYDAGGVIALDMGVDFAADDFNAKLKTGLEFLAEAEGPVLIHCNEGKDRAGFVSALLECLMGATADEIIADYMVTYVNYYHVEVGSAKYKAISASNIEATLCTIAGLAKGSSLEGVDLVAAAENYLKTTVGVSDDVITGIKNLLSAAGDTAAAA